MKHKEILDYSICKRLHNLKIVSLETPHDYWYWEDETLEGYDKPICSYQIDSECYWNYDWFFPALTIIDWLELIKSYTIWKHNGIQVLSILDWKSKFLEETLKECVEGCLVFLLDNNILWQA